MKLDGSRTKVILRRALKRLVPDLVLEKPKEGFSIPMKHWLGTSLKPMMMDLLATETVQMRGYFQPRVVSAWIQDHLQGRANHAHRLWALMVLELWHRA
jgi:asparagine synthase (glutamine-hydrolysing)